MQPTNITYSRTVQAAQYEPETLEVVAVLDEGENLEEAAASLRERVSAVLGRGTRKVAKKEAVREEAPAKEEEEEAKVEEKKTAKKDAKKTSTRKKKAVAYDREVKAHSAELAKILHANFKGWNKDDDMKALAKAASEDLVGADFMDSEGNVLDSFVDAVKERMAGEDSGL